MNLQINCTDNGVKEYPIHIHKDYEIMHYLSGTGNMRTSEGLFPFSPGTIIIIPPGIEHGSTSERGFKNISILGNSERIKHFKTPTILTDNEKKEGTTLVKLMYNNRYTNKEYLKSLYQTYILYLMQSLTIEDNLGASVNKILSQVTDNFSNNDLSMSALLKESGYAEDYIRAHFKRITGKTPNAFLTDVRINHACFLIDLYANSLSLEQISEGCGYIDYVYFSKKFKSVTGMSPTEYKKMVSKQKNNL